VTGAPGGEYTASAMDTAARQPLPKVSWFDVPDPQSPELDELARRFQFHELQVEDCRHRPQRAKTEEHGQYIFTVLKHLHTVGTLEFDDLDIFLGPDYIVTVHDGECGLIEKVRARALESHVPRVDRLFYMLLDLVVDEYSPTLDKLAEDISEIESEVLRRPDPEVLARILELKRKLIEFRRIAGGMREVVNTLARREHGLLSDDLDPYLRDVYDHLVRTVEFIETYRDLLTGSLDIYLSATANRTNEVMKVLTIYGTIAVPLVVITGFFGMNLQLPWMSNPHGALYASGLMVVSTAAVLLYFRVKRWL
jgi:magnesium transporter